MAKTGTGLVKPRQAGRIAPGPPCGGFAHKQNIPFPIAILFSCFRALTKNRKIDARKRPGRSPGASAVLVFLRQQEGGYAAVSLGDDPKAILAVAFGGLVGINGVGRKDAKALMGGLVVAGGVLWAYKAPIAA